MRAIELDDIRQARRTIGEFARQTPLVRSSYLSDISGGEVYLKLENLQTTGAFKVRGAANRMCNLTPDERTRGVIALSTGNHGRALAWVGRKMGIRVVVCVPESVLPHKLMAMQALGADVRVVGVDQDRAEVAALEIAQDEGLTWVSPFDDPWVIAGQGTIGLEILDDLPQVGVVMAALSGGGLLGGIAAAVKGVNPSTKTIGVSMARGAAMVASVAAGKPVQVAEEATLADSLVGGIGMDNRYTFELVREVMDETVLVSEEEIARSIMHCLQEERIVVEGGGAVGIAALLAGKVDVRGKQVACVVSGGNVDWGYVARRLAEQEATPR